MNISESNLILITQHGPRWMMTSHHVIISYTVALTEFRNHVCTFSAVQSITCSQITCSQITTLHSFFFKTFLISKTQILLILPSNTHAHTLTVEQRRYSCVQRLKACSVGGLWAQCLPGLKFQCRVSDPREKFKGHEAVGRGWLRCCKSCMWCSQHFNTRGSSPGPTWLTLSLVM